MAVQAAFEFGINQGDRRGAARGGRDQGVQGRTGAAQVFGGAVDDGLRVGHIVDRSDGAMFDPQRLMDDLHHRGEAIGRAACRRDDPVAGRVIDIVIDAIDDIGRIPVFYRGRDNHFFHPRFEIGGEFCLGLEDAGAVDHHIHPVERQRAEVVRADEGQAGAVDRHAVGVMGEIGLPASMHRVEFQQMGMHFRVAHRVVDPCNLGPLFQQRFQGELADTAKAVDRVGGHAEVPSLSVWPSSSSAFCSEIRSSEVSGRLVKPSIRLRRVP